jgi:hypothetical protein
MAVAGDAEAADLVDGLAEGADDYPEGLAGVGSGGVEGRQKFEGGGPAPALRLTAIVAAECTEE